MFDFLEQQKLQDHHFEQKAEWLIEKCIAKRLITLVWAKGGQGKSWLATGIANHACDKGMNVIYLDYDSSQEALIERGLKHKLIDPNSKLTYLGRMSTTMRPLELLKALDEQTTANRYHNTLVVFDSLRNFTDINNDSKAMLVMDQIMNLREAGATVLILSHANKDGRNYQGSNNIYNSIDNMYQLEKLETQKNHIKFMLTVVKERVAITNVAFDLDTDALALLPINIEEARLTEEDKDFIRQVKVELNKQPGIKKKDILEALGHKATNRPMRDKLEQFDGIYWHVEVGANNANQYYPLK